jgi:hypothetical protein
VRTTRGDERTLKIEDSLAEGVEFELAMDLVTVSQSCKSVNKFYRDSYQKVSGSCSELYLAVDPAFVNHAYQRRLRAAGPSGTRGSTLRCIAAARHSLRKTAKF